MRRMTAASIAGFLILLSAAGTAQTTSTASSESDEATTTALVERAIRLTSERKLDQAENLYRDLAAASPAEGLPLLARFLHRTGRTSAAAELLASPEAAALPPLAGARVAVAAGRPERAIELLQAAPPSAPDLYQRSALLATQLFSRGRKQEAARTLEETVTAPELSPADRRDLFLKLSVIGGPDHLRRALPPLVAQLLTSSSLTYPQLREVAVQGMMVISGSSAYSDFHAAVEADRGTSPSQAWLYALSMVRKGAPAEARAALDAFTTSPLTPREKMVLFEELARMLPDNPVRAVSLYEQLIPIVPDPDRLRLITAQMYFRSRNYTRSAELLEPVETSRLDEAEVGIYKNTLLASVAAVRPGDALVRAFEKETADVTYEQARELAEAPFVTLPAGADKALKEALDARFRQPDAPPELRILQLSYENRFGNPEQMLQALGHYVDARPNAIQAAEEYAAAAAQQAYQVMTAEGQSVQPTSDQKKEVGDRAARALWRIIGTRPYAPEPYLQLVELYRLYNEPEKAARVPLALSDPTTATAEEVHLAAYISAQADMATQSIPLYERALKMDPGNPRYRLNYAGALTRVDRIRDADAIYRDIIEHGVAGRQYHAHEVYANAFRLAEQKGYADEFLVFLKSLISRPEIPQHDVYLVELAKILIGLEHPQEAVPFLEAAIARYPAHRFQSADLLVQAYVAMRRFEEAGRILAQQEKESTDTASLVLVRSNYAAMKATQGDLAAAIEEWKQLAAKYPNERQATRSLLTAAQTLIKEGRLRTATGLLESYLALGAGDPDGESTARETLERIRSKDLPSEILVKAALEDTQPAVR